MNNKLLEIFRNIGIAVEDINEELQIDSFQFVHIIVEIENEFLITIGEEDFLNHEYKSVQDFSDLINKYCSLIEGK